MICPPICNILFATYLKVSIMFEKFRVIKSVDNEGRKVVTYIKNTVDGNGKAKPGKNGITRERLPDALQVTVRLP